MGGGEVSILPLTSPKSEIFVWRFYNKELSLEGVIKKTKNKTRCGIQIQIGGVNLKSFVPAALRHGNGSSGLDSQQLPSFPASLGY